MNFNELIKNDAVLSAYDYGLTYQIILRLDALGILCKCKTKKSMER